MQLHQRATNGIDGSTDFARDLRVEYQIRCRGHRALRLLLDAHQYASLLSQDFWQFAVDLKTLLSAGLSVNDVRWLLCSRFVEHGQETTPHGASQRSFRPVGALGFEGLSSFVLTEKGVAFVRGEDTPDALIKNMSPIESLPQSPVERAMPRWDCDRQELRLEEKLVKRFKTPAPNQELILATFEEIGWPIHIDDPLPPGRFHDPKRRLHDTINALNRHQIEPLVRFIGDGHGEGVRWEPRTGTRERAKI